MPILTKADKINYVPKRLKINTIKYGNGINQSYGGETLYLPKLMYNGNGVDLWSGNGILDTIGSFLLNNKDNISAIANTIGTVGDTICKATGTTIDIIKRARELKQNGLTNEIAEKILKETSDKVLTSNSPENRTLGSKTGNGFYYIK